MLNHQARIFIALALVAFVCNAALAHEELVLVPADTRPLVETFTRGHRFSVPLNEDVVFTEQKRAQDVKYTKKILEKLKDMSRAVLLEKRSYFRVAGKVLSLVPTFRSYLIDDNKLAKTDTSPPYKSGFGREMSLFMKDIMNTKTELNISDAEAFRRSDLLMDGILEIMEKSPASGYLDWNKFTIDGERLADFTAPVVKYLRENGYNQALKIVDLLGSKMNKLGKRE